LEDLFDFGFSESFILTGFADAAEDLLELS
jgi:hypothetical protein